MEKEKRDINEEEFTIGHKLKKIYDSCKNNNKCNCVKCIDFDFLKITGLCGCSFGCYLKFTTDYFERCKSKFE